MPLDIPEPVTASVPGDATDRRGARPVPDMRRDSTPHPVTVIGVYGKGNFGDEALLAAVADDLGAVLGSVEVQVLCSDPESVTRRFGFNAMTRTPLSDFGAKLAMIRRSRVVAVGGGTLLCDHGRWTRDIVALITYFFWLLLARAFGVASLAYGQGFGPASSPIIRFGMWLLPRVVSGVTTRDRASHAMLTSIAGERANCALGCDPVVASDRFHPKTVTSGMPPMHARQVTALAPYVLVALRYPKLATLASARAYIAAACHVVAALGRHEQARFVLFPTHLSDRLQDDRPVLAIARELLIGEGIAADRLTCVTWETLDDAALWIQSADLVFGDRLHALLLGMLAHRQVVGLTVEDKIAGCIGDIVSGHSVALVASVLDDEPLRLQAEVERLWNERGSNVDAYRALLDTYRERRNVNLAMIERVVRPSGLTAAAPSDREESAWAPARPGAHAVAQQSQIDSGARPGGDHTAARNVAEAVEK